MRTNRPLRGVALRIAAYYAMLFALSVLVLFGAVFWASIEEVTDQLRLATKAEVEGLLVLHQAQGIEALRQEVLARATSGRNEEAVYALRDADGRIVAGNAALSHAVPGWNFVRVAVPPAAGSDQHGDDRFMLLGSNVGDNLLVVGRSLQPIDEIQEALLRGFSWGGGLTMLLALLGGVVMSRTALRRIEAISAATEEIMQGNLARRLPVAGSGDDIDQLSMVINRMLERIQALMDNLRQVSNDIAHDLRMPLGRLRQRLEAARAQSGDAQASQAAIDRAMTDVDAILETFTALLRIAQVETGARRARFARFDLSELARSMVETFEAVAESQGQHLSGMVSPDVALYGDRELVAQALANLVENAIRYTPPGGRIEVGLAAGGAGPLLTVDDSGPGIPAQEREKVLRRFYRIENSRTTPGNGLGLALVKAVADLHQAQIELSDNRPGLRVAIRFVNRTRP